VLVIIPLQGEATIPGGIPIFSDLVIFVEGIQEVCDIVPVGIVDGKVIHNQSELDVAGVMLPQAGGEGAWMVAVWEQELLELVICNFASL